MTAPLGYVSADGQFPDVARTVAALLIAQAFVAPGRAGTETPANLLSALPFVRIGRVAGNSDRVNDYPVVDIEVFDTTSLAGLGLAELIRQYLITPDLPVVPGQGLIDRVECVTGPHELGWADPKVRRFGATYRITARRHRPA